MSEKKEAVGRRQRQTPQAGLYVKAQRWEPQRRGWGLWTQGRGQHSEKLEQQEQTGNRTQGEKEWLSINARAFGGKSQSLIRKHKKGPDS